MFRKEMADKKKKGSFLAKDSFPAKREKHLPVSQSHSA